MNDLMGKLEEKVNRPTIIQLISYKRFLECTLIQWRLSIYPQCTQVAEGTFFMKSLVAKDNIKYNKKSINFYKLSSLYVLLYIVFVHCSACFRFLVYVYAGNLSSIYGKGQVDVFHYIKCTFNQNLRLENKYLRVLQLNNEFYDAKKKTHVHCTFIVYC